MSGGGAVEEWDQEEGQWRNSVRGWGGGGIGSGGGAVEE